jgi:hypothetical protein
MRLWAAAVSSSLALTLLARPPAGAQSDDSCADAALAAAVARPDSQGRTLLFDQFVQPLLDESARRRAEWAAEDAGYTHRVDADLNASRLNVALLGFGEEHDQTYGDTGISVTILSLNLQTWDLMSISLSRDIRAPELEDQSARVPPRWPVTLRAAYKSGGFERVRTILEDATGLAIDFQVLMKDVFVRNYLDAVSGPVELTVPQDFATNTYRLDGVDHPPDLISAGRQTLSTDKAMTFVLGEVEDPQGRADERSYRKDLLLRTLVCDARQRFGARDVGFALNLARFSLGELKNQDLTSDFDFGVITHSLAGLAQAFVGARGDVDSTFPQLGSGRELVVHDEAFGDGGVRRVHYMALTPDAYGIPENPQVAQEIQLGSLAPYLLIPLGGNPYADDLVTDYWGSVRDLIRSRLTSDPVEPASPG